MPATAATSSTRERAACHQVAQLGSERTRIHPVIANLHPVWRAPPYQRPFVEAFYLEKASREGRMLTLGGKLLDFAEKAATDRKKSRGAVVTDELALGADEAGLLGRLLTVEPDLGHGAAVAR